MKKICLVDYDMTVKGGVEQVTATLAGMLCDYYEVYVISLSKKNQTVPYDFDPRVNYVETLGIKKSRIREVMMENFFPVRKFLKKNKIDCVLVMGTYPGIVMSLICKGLKVKSIFCDHGALMNQWEDKTITNYRKTAYSNMNKTVTLTEKSMKDYIKYLNADESKMEYIYNSIDDRIFSYVEPYNPENKVIMSCGRITKEKGFDMLVEVAEKVFQNETDWVWQIYGDGTLYGEISDKIKEKHLEDKVLMMGETKEMYSKYSECGIFALTSYREGLPLVLLEAKANHIPIVSFDVETGPSEIVRDGVDGYLIPTYDKKKMAEKLLELMESQERRVEFSDCAAQNIDKFMSASIGEKWKRVIDSVLN